MGSDTAAANVSKDLGGKRKKANRSAKLKQCKLDARREQWLSQVKNKNCKLVEVQGPVSPPPLAKISSVERVHEDINCDVKDSSQKDILSIITDKHSSDEEEEETAQGIEEDSLDDWETVADTLTFPQISPNRVQLEADSAAIPERIPRAWKSDDAFRPRSLPNLQNHRKSFSLDVALTCPICYEDLDRTDSSFRPCCCGFNLCLFCHKKILEADGRCPGCRTLYGDVGTPALVISLF